MLSACDYCTGTRERIGEQTILQYHCQGLQQRLVGTGAKQCIDKVAVRYCLKMQQPAESCESLLQGLQQPQGSPVQEDLNMIAIIGTSDRPCWLAEACKILLLLLQVLLLRVWARSV